MKTEQSPDDQLCILCGPSNRIVKAQLRRLVSSPSSLDTSTSQIVSLLERHITFVDRAFFDRHSVELTLHLRQRKTRLSSKNLPPRMPRWLFTFPT